MPRNISSKEVEAKAKALETEVILAKGNQEVLKSTVDNLNAQLHAYSVKLTNAGVELVDSRRAFEALKDELSRTRQLLARTQEALLQVIETHM